MSSQPERVTSEPEPLERVYSRAEVSAFRRLSPRLWNQDYKPGRGPAWFACGPWWPEELRRRARQAERDIAAMLLAADAMEREGCR